MVAFTGADRTALPEDGRQGWAASNAAGCNAADLLPAAMVCAQRSDSRGKSLRQRRHAPFAGLELGEDRVPDETTILHFRHLLERNALPEAIFAEVNAHLTENGVTLRSGTMIDATIIDGPSSTKSKTGKRDPEMTSTKKGNDWYFGMKAHVGVDADSGVVHSLETSTAKMHDSCIWDELLHGGETSVWADTRQLS